MANRLEVLLNEIKALEKELIGEIESKKKEYSYEAIKSAIHFKEEVVSLHRAQATRIRDYLRQAKLRNIATAPIIWLNLIPAVLMDLVVTFFQFSCFPIYGIPKVKRSDYIVIDRHYLQYLNLIEKINCVYCGYFNGVIAYVQEVAARTEQYWCPIKHARNLKTMHNRYSQFSEFGDSEHFHKNFRKLRNKFDDLK